MNRSNNYETVRLTGSTAFSATQLGPALVEFTRQTPDVRFQLKIDDNNLDLAAERMDIGIRMGKGALEGAGIRYLGIIRRVLVASASYLERQPAPSKPSDLHEHDCITPKLDDDYPVWPFAGPDGEETVEIDGCVRVNSAVVEREAVLAGLGISLLPTFAVGPDLKTGRLVEVLPNHRASSLLLYAHYPKPPSDAARRVSDYLAERFGDQPSWDQ